MSSPTSTPSTNEPAAEFNLFDLRLVTHCELAEKHDLIRSQQFNNLEEFSQFLTTNRVRSSGNRKSLRFPLKRWFCGACLELLTFTCGKERLRHEISGKHVAALQRLFPEILLGKAGYECPYCLNLFRDDHVKKHMDVCDQGPENREPRKKPKILAEKSTDEWTHLSPGSWSSSLRPSSERSSSSSPSPQPSSPGAFSPTSSFSSLSSHRSSTSKPYARLNVRKTPRRTPCGSSASCASPALSVVDSPQITVSIAPPAPLLPSRQTLVAPPHLDANPTAGHMLYPFANYTPANFMQYASSPPVLEPEVVQQPGWVPLPFYPDALVFPGVEQWTQLDQVDAQSTPRSSTPDPDPSQHQ